MKTVKLSSIAEESILRVKAAEEYYKKSNTFKYKFSKDIVGSLWWNWIKICNNTLIISDL